MKKSILYLTFTFLASTVAVKGHGTFRLGNADEAGIREKITKITKSLPDLNKMISSTAENETLKGRIDNKEAKLKLLKSFLTKDSNPRTLDEQFQALQIKALDITENTISDIEVSVMRSKDRKNFVLTHPRFKALSKSGQKKALAYFNVKGETNEKKDEEIKPIATVPAAQGVAAVEPMTEPRPSVLHLDADLQKAYSKIQAFSSLYDKVGETQVKAHARSETVKRFLSCLAYLTETIDTSVRKALLIEEGRRKRVSEGTPTQEEIEYVLDEEGLDRYKKILEAHLEWVTHSSGTLEDKIKLFFRENFSASESKRRSELIQLFFNLHYPALAVIYKSPDSKYVGEPTNLDQYMSQSIYGKPAEGWITYNTVGNESQGYKLHVSAKPETALKVLLLVKPILDRRGVHYKHAGSMSHLGWLSQLIDQRGKFITIYPRSDQEAAEIAVELDRVLQVCPKDYFETPPYDAPLGNTGGLFTRYGGYKENILEERDSQGRVVRTHPDNRNGPYKPSWVTSHPFGNLLNEPMNPDARY